MAYKNAWEQVIAWVDTNMPELFKHGVQSIQSDSPITRELARSGCVLKLALEGDAISAQIINAYRVGFPKPLTPRIFEIKYRNDEVFLLSPNGDEETVQETINNLVGWLLSEADC
jgi:hypothetical protein